MSAELPSGKQPTTLVLLRISRLALESILNIYQDNPVAGIEDFRQHLEAISEVVRI